LSFAVFTQVLLQLVRPELQSTPQLPALQTGVPCVTGGQTLPHFPQFCGSRLALTHAPPHSMKPFWQVNPHLPAVQLAEALLGTLQTVPQAPQFDVSFLTSTHEPSQFKVPVAQATTHCPPVHT
jgi:hypothetical protein